MVEQRIQGFTLNTPTQDSTFAMAPGDNPPPSDNPPPGADAMQTAILDFLANVSVDRQQNQEMWKAVMNAITELTTVVQAVVAAQPPILAPESMGAPLREADAESARPSVPRAPREEPPHLTVPRTSGGTVDFRNVPKVEASMVPSFDPSAEEEDVSKKVYRGPVRFLQALRSVLSGWSEGSPYEVKEYQRRVLAAVPGRLAGQAVDWHSLGLDDAKRKALRVDYDLQIWSTLLIDHFRVNPVTAFQRLQAREWNVQREKFSQFVYAKHALYVEHCPEYLHSPGDIKSFIMPLWLCLPPELKLHIPPKKILACASLSDVIAMVEEYETGYEAYAKPVVQPSAFAMQAPVLTANAPRSAPFSDGPAPASARKAAPRRFQYDPRRVGKATMPDGSTVRTYQFDNGMTRRLKTPCAHCGDESCRCRTVITASFASTFTPKSVTASARSVTRSATSHTPASASAYTGASGVSSPCGFGQKITSGGRCENTQARPMLIAFVVVVPICFLLAAVLGVRRLRRRGELGGSCVGRNNPLITPLQYGPSMPRVTQPVPLPPVADLPTRVAYFRVPPSRPVREEHDEDLARVIRISLNESRPRRLRTQPEIDDPPPPYVVSPSPEYRS